MPQEIYAAPASSSVFAQSMQGSTWSTKFVHGSLGSDVSLAIGVDPGLHPGEGDSLQLSLCPESIHFFDAESGERL